MEPQSPRQSWSARLKGETDGQSGVNGGFYHYAPDQPGGESRHEEPREENQDRGDQLCQG
ncbi:MAG: hypothetical protein WD492_02245 [Alkalispirochaeta sp.]